MIFYQQLKEKVEDAEQVADKIQVTLSWIILNTKVYEIIMQHLKKKVFFFR